MIQQLLFHVLYQQLNANSTNANTLDAPNPISSSRAKKGKKIIKLQLIRPPVKMFRHVDDSSFDSEGAISDEEETKIRKLNTKKSIQSQKHNEDVIKNSLTKKKSKKKRKKRHLGMNRVRERQ